MKYCTIDPIFVNESSRQAVMTDTDTYYIERIADVTQLNLAKLRQRCSDIRNQNRSVFLLKPSSTSSFRL